MTTLTQRREVPDHSTQVEGTARGCTECIRFAYEPGWYTALRESAKARKLILDLTRARQPVPV